MDSKAHSRAPFGGWMLDGHCWTRRSTALHLGVTPEQVVADPRLLRIDHPIALEEAYPAFQFDDYGVRWELEPLLLLLRRRVADHEAADWLIRSNPALANQAPLAWLSTTRSLRPVLNSLPEPTRPLPGGDDRAGKASAARSWTEAQSAAAGEARARRGEEARRRRKKIGRPPHAGPIPA